MGRSREARAKHAHCARASRLLTSHSSTVMPYAERGRVCVACVAIQAAVNGLNGQCVAIHMLGGDDSLVSEILKEFGVCRCNASAAGNAGCTFSEPHGHRLKKPIGSRQPHNCEWLPPTGSGVAAISRSLGKGTSSSKMTELCRTRSSYDVPTVAYG